MDARTQKLLGGIANRSQKVAPASKSKIAARTKPANPLESLEGYLIARRKTVLEYLRLVPDAPEELRRFRDCVEETLGPRTLGIFSAEIEGAKKLVVCVEIPDTKAGAVDLAKLVHECGPRIGAGRAVGFMILPRLDVEAHLARLDHHG
jgi:hypothetical protein